MHPAARTILLYTFVPYRHTLELLRVDNEGRQTVIKTWEKCDIRPLNIIENQLRISGIVTEPAVHVRQPVSVLPPRSERVDEGILKSPNVGISVWAQLGRAFKLGSR